MNLVKNNLACVWKSLFLHTEAVDHGSYRCIGASHPMCNVPYLAMVLNTLL